jgi:uncharacterized protein
MRSSPFWPKTRPALFLYDDGVKMNVDRISFCAHYGPWGLIAGASQGLGAEYARQLAEIGLNLVIVARRADVLAALADDLRRRFPVQVRPVACDLSGGDAAAQVAAQTADLEVGLLVYNAALAPVAPFFDLPLDEHLRAVATNVQTPLALAYLFGKAMRARRRGGIVLMSSLSAAQGSALISNYAATKAYNQVLAEGLWDELRQDGVDVLASLPASIATPGYLADLPGDRHSPTQAMAPQQVAAETLAALGKQPTVVPGLSNRLAAFTMRHLFPRRSAIRLMGRVLRGMYPQS